MKVLLLAFLTTLPLPLLAQKDPLEDLNRERMREERNRSYRQGEEVWAMIGRSMRREAGPTLKPRLAALTNESILALKSAGLSDDTIIKAISTQPTTFDITPFGLIELKRKGLSENILNAMMEADGGTAGNLIPLDKNGLPSEIGVYYIQKNLITELEAEPATWQAGGVWKAILTRLPAAVFFPPMIFLGTNGHLNGKLMGTRGKTVLPRDSEIVIHTAEGFSASEYQLLQMYEKGNRREFRIFTGGVIHRSTGAERTSVAFSSRKIAPRTYFLILNNLPRGEYGLLAPGSSLSRTDGIVGRVYSFSVE